MLIFGDFLGWSCKKLGHLKVFLETQYLLARFPLGFPLGYLDFCLVFSGLIHVYLYWGLESTCEVFLEELFYGLFMAMVNNQEDGERNPSTLSRGGNGGGGGSTRSWGTTVSGQSVSTSGSVGSPSSRSEAAMATPASESTFLRLNNLDIHGDDAGSQGAAG